MALTTTKGYYHGKGKNNIKMRMCKREGPFCHSRANWSIQGIVGPRAFDFQQAKSDSIWVSPSPIYGGE
jgi:hypothetical protein